MGRPMESLAPRCVYRSRSPSATVIPGPGGTALCPS